MQLVVNAAIGARRGASPRTDTVMMMPLDEIAWIGRLFRAIGAEIPCVYDRRQLAGHMRGLSES
ncbi:MAG: hypothetical protein HKL84_05915 [Acidimicrobiaceae bacterium]|nr:hypothetical protein [Acidimicrobiaceae bacterium]